MFKSHLFSVGVNAPSVEVGGGMAGWAQPTLNRKTGKKERNGKEIKERKKER